MRLPSISEFNAMPNESKSTFLHYLRETEDYLNDAARDWLKEMMVFEADDILRAMMAEMAGAHVDEKEIRSLLEKLMGEIPNSSLTYQMILALLITAVSDEMAAVREWGGRLLQEEESVNPADPGAFADYLWKILDNPKLSPYPRWHAALVLSDLKTEKGAERLIDFLRKASENPVYETSGSQIKEMKWEGERLVAEKVIYAIALSAQRIATAGMIEEAIERIEKIASKIYPEEGASHPTISWSYRQLAARKKQNEKEDVPETIAEKRERKASLTDRLLEILWEFFSVKNFQRFGTVAAGACLVLVIALYGLLKGPDQIVNRPVFLQFNLLGNTDRSPIPSRGENGSTEVFEVRPGGSLKSGEYYKIRFKLDRDAFIYIISHDSSGQITGINAGKRKGGMVHTVPESRYGFQLDDKIGEETLYLLAAASPIEDFENRYKRLEESGIRKMEEIFPNATITALSFMHE